MRAARRLCAGFAPHDTAFTFCFCVLFLCNNYLLAAALFQRGMRGRIPSTVLWPGVYSFDRAELSPLQQIALESAIKSSIHSLHCCCVRQRRGLIWHMARVRRCVLSRSRVAPRVTAFRYQRSSSVVVFPPQHCRICEVPRTGI